MKKKPAKSKPKTSTRQKVKGCRRPSFCSAFRVGNKVQDSWWPSVCGTVIKVTSRMVYVRLRYPSLCDWHQMRDGVVPYDHQHARRYLKLTPNA